MTEQKKRYNPKTREVIEWRVPIEADRKVRFPDMVIAGFRIDGEEIVVERVQWRHPSGSVQVQSPWES
jgi:hypothetical protein